ncbi:hypothetical protein QR46_4932 [Giardia duodenalis assemblage B]|uniref:Variant-specific surface protein n=1 Tax=Giardia duodenalis assemblage B TaxID=1394984 RepID=A0A132NM61_GIAIN|nr:hypothetical protein QR46_4932 [Giardia intestinalis assemblage B]
MPLRMRGRVSRLVGQIVTALQLWCIYSSSDMDLHPPLGGCYDARAAPGSDVCREARDGACVRHAEKNKTDRASARVIKVGAEGNTCEEATSGTAGKCLTSHCDVTIGGSQYCSQCSKNDDHLVDGKCMAADEDANSNCVSNNQGSCTSCANSYFMYQGGCYQTGNQNPGNTLCTAAANGICTQAAEGYFVPPSATASKQSVIKCDDIAGVTVGSINYKGIANCAECAAPQAGDSGDKPATCKACADGYFVDSDGAACTQCQDTDNCVKCDAGADKCTKCKASGTKPYFKKNDGDDPTGTCVTREECKTTHFPKDISDSDKKCLPCGDATNGGIANCQACTMSGSAVTCDTCTEGKKPNTAKTTCVPCSIADCASCDKGNVCATCDSGKYLTPTGQCVDKCEKLGGYYADSSNVCQPCDPSCASCSTAGADKCLSCPAGKVLQYTDDTKVDQGGSCVDECKANTGGCETCGAVIGGSRYCSKCSDTSQAPLNGDCAANTARTKFCTQVDGGACTQCATGYFLLDGGCYQTSRQPGKSVCTTESGGKCATCVNGQTADTSTGACPACPAGCSKCNGNSGSETCSECLAGYYKSGSKCFKCTADSNENSNSITGISNCVSCAPPAGSGPVTCYVTQTPTVDPTDPSVNKGGLSTGAIAGISVAAVVVVGGLVGFLCWWFMCRGKA